MAEKIRQIEIGGEGTPLENVTEFVFNLLGSKVHCRKIQLIAQITKANFASDLGEKNTATPSGAVFPFFFVQSG